MKLGPVTKLDKRNKIFENLTMTSCQKIMTLLSFFRFMTNLEQPRSRIPDVWSMKLIFPLIATFYLTKMKSRTKKLKYL